MNKEELKEMGRELKEILGKYPNRQKEILFYIFGEDTIREIIGKPTYEELKQKVNQLETNRDEVIKELKKFKNNAWSLTFYTKIEEFIEILERGNFNE